MAQIDKLLGNMAANNVELITIVNGQPMVLQRGERQAQGAVLSLTIMMGMLREIVPPEHRVRLASDCKFEFHHHAPSGYFDLAVVRRKDAFQIVIHCIAPTVSSASLSNSDSQWSPQLLSQVGGHSKAVNSVALSPDNSTLASSSLDGSVRLWSVADGVKKAELRSATRNSIGAYSVSFSSDGQFLMDGRERWDTRMEDLLEDIELGLGIEDLMEEQAKNAKVGIYLTNAVAYSPDDRMMARASTYEPPPPPSAGMEALTLALEVASVVTGYGNSAPKVDLPPIMLSVNKISDITAGKSNGWFSTDFKDPIVSVRFSPDNHTIACCDSNGRVKFFDIHVKPSVWKRSVIGGPSQLQVQKTVEFNGSPLSFEFSSDGRHLLVLSNYHVHWFNVKAHYTEFQQHCGAVAACLVGTNYIALSTSDPGGCIQFVSLQGQSLKNKTLALPSLATSLGASKDGRLLACGCRDGSIQVWRL